MTLFKIIRRSIKWKLVAMISLVLLSVVLSVVYFTYYKASEIIEKDAVEFSTQILNQINLNLNRYMLGYQQGFLTITSNSATEQWLSVDAGDHLSSYIAFQKIINDYLQVFIYQHPEVLSFTFYNTNGNEMHFTHRYGLDAGYGFAKEHYIDLLEQQDGIYFEVRFSDHYVKDNLPVMTMVKKVTFGPHVGYVKLDIDLGPAVDIVNNIEIGSSGLTLISDAEGQIIAHPDLKKITTYLEEDIVSRLAEGSGWFKRQSSNEMVMFQTVPSTNWKVISIIPYYEFAESVYHIRQFTILTVLSGLALSIIAIIALSSSFTKRIRMMKQAMMMSKLGNFNERVIVQGKDEIADLGHTYNTMLDHLEDSIQQLAESKMQQQQATLSALQSQIDSHFLYNTLETINAMANLANHQPIEQMTLALSRMLRYTSDYKTTLVMVEEELRHLQDYLEIIQIRYGEKISYQLDVEEECKEALCLRAVIQPLVENSIKHNVDVNGKPLHIQVQVQRVGEQLVQITIMDNGIGFSEEKLEELHRSIAAINAGQMKKSFSRIGLLNVHHRLRVYYPVAEEAGISVSNLQDAGARVSVTFPLEYAERRQPHVSHHRGG